MAETILVVEDDRMIQDPLKLQFERAGFRVVQAFDGNQAVALAREQAPDIVLLDVMLPGMDGWAVCRTLREESPVPILMLTARDQEMDRIFGLEIGADDYIVKPFSFHELLARVRANLRRISLDGARAAPSPPPEELRRVGSLSIDLRRHQVTRNESAVTLSHREFELLRVLAAANGAVLERDALLNQVWGSDWVGDPRTVDVHIRWLREKLEDEPGTPRLILTVRGVGYRMVTADEI
jgi:DNA-binding response OmpR family regulator